MEPHHRFRSESDSLMSKAEILNELHFRQCRLGTADEEPGDFVRVRELAHQLHNVLTAEWLTREITVISVQTPLPK